MGEERLFIFCNLAVDEQHDGEMLQVFNLLLLALRHSNGDAILVGFLPIVNAEVVILLGQFELLSDMDKDISFLFQNVFVGIGDGHQVDDVHHPGLLFIGWHGDGGLVLGGLRPFQGARACGSRRADFERWMLMASV